MRCRDRLSKKCLQQGSQKKLPWVVVPVSKRDGKEELFSINVSREGGFQGGKSIEGFL